MSTAAIVVAAGEGLRLGAAKPKALVNVGGVPLVMHVFLQLLDALSVDLVVVAAPEAHVEYVHHLLGGRAVVVPGGSTRHESVGRALAALPDEVDVVLVHDAARAYAPSWLFDEVVRAVRAGADAVIPALPVTDTIKRVAASRAGSPHEVVVDTPDRSSLRAVQTPQGFRRQALVRAHALAGTAHTDDAGAIEAMGGTVVVIHGSPEAFKITGPLDLLLAEALQLKRDEEES